MHRLSRDSLLAGHIGLGVTLVTSACACQRRSLSTTALSVVPPRKNKTKTGNLHTLPPHPRHGGDVCLATSLSRHRPQIILFYAFLYISCFFFSDISPSTRPPCVSRDLRFRPFVERRRGRRRCWLLFRKFAVQACVLFLARADVCFYARRRCRESARTVT